MMRQMFLTLLCCVLLLPAALSAKSYEITSVQIDAQLTRKGNMKVVEHRTFNFNGQFSYSFRSFPKDRVNYTEIRVSENGVDFVESSDGSPNTFELIDRGSRMEVRWYYDAQDEERTFTISYKVRKLVERGKDAAVLYYKFIGNDWTQSQKHVVISLSPPSDLEQAEVNAWLHGPLWGEYRIEKNGVISAWCDNYPAKTFFEVRALYPLESFPKAKENPRLIRSQIMNDEAVWAGQANQRRLDAVQSENNRKERWKYGFPFALLISFLGLGGLYLLYQRYGRRPELPERKPEFLSTSPSKDPPALIAYLLGNEMVTGSALVSTLFDLAEKGYLEMHEEMKTKPKFWGGTKEVQSYSWKLDRAKYHSDPPKFGFERSAVDFLFNDISSGSDVLEVEELKSKSSEMIKFFSGWKKEVKEEGRRFNWVNQESKKGLYYGLALNGVLSIPVILGIIFLGPWVVFAAVVLVVLLILSFFIPHNTTEGKLLKNRWKAFSKYLRKGRYKSASASRPELGKYFVYGSVLGLTENNFKEMAQYFPDEHVRQSVVWYYGYSNNSFSGEAFSSSFSAMVATTSSSMSTATGSGGGASGGGGGGAGGGGGGAG